MMAKTIKPSFTPLEAREIRHALEEVIAFRKSEGFGHSSVKSALSKIEAAERG